jgi:hypothetical protein
MFRRLIRHLAHLLLGPASRAGRQVLDADARLALAPRAMETGLPRAVAMPDTTAPAPRRVGHLLVYEGGRRGLRTPGDGPFGRPSPVSRGAGGELRRGDGSR